MIKAEMYCQRFEKVKKTQFLDNSTNILWYLDRVQRRRLWSGVLRQSPASRVHKTIFSWLVAAQPKCCPNRFSCWPAVWMCTMFMCPGIVADVQTSLLPLVMTFLNNNISSHIGTLYHLPPVSLGHDPVSLHVLQLRGDEVHHGDGQQPGHAI